MAMYLLILCLVYLSSVEGQPCTQLPSQQAISSDLAAGAGLASVELMETFHNCIVYGANGNGFTNATITGRFNPGSRLGQIIYTCIDSTWRPTEVVLNTGVTQIVVGGCSDCSSGTTLTQTCTGAL